MALKFAAKKIFPNILIFSSLIIGTLAIDYILHIFNLASIGRYFGILGTCMIMISFLYSAKKRKQINSGNIKTLLKNHEILGWGGSLIILVHGGIHFNAIIPWLAVFSMIIVVASGLTGKYLLKEAKESLVEKKEMLLSSGKSVADVEKEIFVLSLMVKKMQRWRKIHMPLTMVFIALALIHISTIILFWVF